MVGKSKKYIAANVAAQWVSLAANITMMTAVTSFLQDCLPELLRARKAPQTDPD